MPLPVVPGQHKPAAAAAAAAGLPAGARAAASAEPTSSLTAKTAASAAPKGDSECQYYSNPAPVITASGDVTMRSFLLRAMCMAPGPITIFVADDYMEMDVAQIWELPAQQFMEDSVFCITLCEAIASRVTGMFLRGWQRLSHNQLLLVCSRHDSSRLSFDDQCVNVPVSHTNKDEC